MNKPYFCQSFFLIDWRHKRLKNTIDLLLFYGENFYRFLEIVLFNKKYALRFTILLFTFYHFTILRFTQDGYTICLKSHQLFTDNSSCVCSGLLLFIQSFLYSLIESLYSGLL